MRDRIPCEYYLVRYVPNVVREEFVNIGVILRPLSRELGGKADDGVVCFTRDWSRVLSLSPHADITLLESVANEFAKRICGVPPNDPPLSSEKIHDVFAIFEEQYFSQNGTPEADDFLAELRNTLSNSIQITEPRTCLAESAALEMEHLMQMFVEPE